MADPLEDLHYLSGVSKNAPIPPVGDIDDIVIMSPLLQHSACRSKPSSYNNSKVNAQTIPSLRVVSEAGIDRSLVKRWLSECSKNHSLCATEEHTANLALLLIDVQRKCLVVTTDARYFALSYVWGNADQLLLKQENVVELSKDGALHRHWAEMANVLKDAIHFVDSLSERYLWADTLCIIQDSPGRHAYLSRMNEIYRGAVCTLVAIDFTSAMSPLPGVQPRSRVTKSLGQNSSVEVVRKRSDLASAFTTSVYEGRAWTFQERILSSRCLYFMKEQLYFQCQETIWSEDRFEYCKQHFGTEGRYPSLQWIGQRINLSEYRKFQAYSQLVAHFSKKELSYSSDRLNVFSWNHQ